MLTVLEMGYFNFISGANNLHRTPFLRFNYASVSFEPLFGSSLSHQENSEILLQPELNSFFPGRRRHISPRLHMPQTTRLRALYPRRHLPATIKRNPLWLNSHLNLRRRGIRLRHLYRHPRRREENQSKVLRRCRWQNRVY